MRRFFRLAFTLCALLGFLVLCVSFTPLVSSAASQLSVDWYQGDADVLVILGGSMLVDGVGPQATLGYDSYLRCVYSSWSLQRYRYKYVVLSGPEGLAETMARYLIAHGARPEQLLIENAAHTTMENAVFVKKILDHQPDIPKNVKIAVLTSDFHSLRASLVFRRLGIPVRLIPVPDLGKRAQTVALRWNAFLDLTEELIKIGFYKVSGKI